MSGSDRRKAPRVPAGAAGRLRGEGGRNCRLANLSTTGALVVVEEPIKEMVVVRVEFDLGNEDDRKSVELDAVVVRCQPRPDGLFDAGLYFTAVAPECRRAIQNWVDTANLLSPL